eukprot:1200244-Alexandrium_andersonii.AAC.1
MPCRGIPCRALPCQAPLHVCMRLYCRKQRYAVLGCSVLCWALLGCAVPVSYTHLRAHETSAHL